MTRQIINVGVADKGNGDPIRVAFSKANDNFAELYNILSNNTGGSIITTDVIGSVFADDSTLLVDGINGRIPYSVLSGAPTIPAAQVQSNWTAASGMGVILNKPTFATVATTGAYADLTGKPTIPTSFSSLVNGAHQVALVVGGAGPYVTFPADDGVSIGFQGGDIGIIGGEALLSSTEYGVRLTANATGTRKDWEFATDGSLTLPGDLKWPSGGGNIRSDGNIDIEINLADSTLRRWQFGEDGNLVVPGDINLSGGTISRYSQNGLTGLKLVANADQGQNVTIMGTGNNTFPILNYVGTTLSGITIGTPEGDWNFMNGNLTIPGDIRSENNINIDINLSDSTLRRWTFGEDGNLTLPTGSSIADAVGNAVIGSNSGTVSIYTLEVMNFTQLAPSNYLWITNQYYSGSLLTSTFGSISGTAVGTTHPVVGLTQLSTSGRGSGAIFQVTVYYNGSSTTYINVGIYYNGGNQQYGTGYAVGDTVTIAGADLGGTTPANNLTFTIGNAVKNNYPAGIEGRIIYDYSNKHFLAYNGSTWTQLDNPLTPNGTKASNAYGVAGQTSYDSNYFYICIATNTWRRVALGSSY